MYLLDWNFLKEGDIILSRKDSRESRLIRRESKSDYSHAALYMGTLHCIHSDGLGVESQNIQRLLFESEKDVVVLRLSQEPEKHILDKIMIFARRKIGTEYSSSETRLSLANPNEHAKEENRQFCTRFVAQAYEYAGVNIVPNPAYCTPQNIYQSKLLTEVNCKLLKASDEEIRFTEETEDLLSRETDARNKILNDCRNLTNLDIQTYGQLAEFVKGNPECENEIITILRESNFLEIIGSDKESNPWHYDYSEFIKYYVSPDKRKEVAHVLVSQCPELRKRYAQTLESLKFDYAFLQQRYFLILIEKFEQLTELCLQMETVGHQALNEYLN